MIYMEKLLEDCNEVIKHFNEVIKIKKSKKLLPPRPRKPPPRPRKDIVQGFLMTLHFYSIKKILHGIFHTCGSSPGALFTFEI